MQYNDPVFNPDLSNNTALDRLKSFASIFIPIYSFFKDLFSNFSIPDIFSFNFSFDPVVNIAQKVMDFGVSIYNSGKNAICSAFDSVANAGKSVVDYSVKLGKNVYSSISNFFGGGDSTESVSDEQVEKTLNDSSHTETVSQEVNQSSNNQEISRPFWKSLDKINDPNQSVSTGKKFFNHFKTLQNTSRLDNTFLVEGQNSILQINGQRVSKNSPKSMLEDFKAIVPNLKSRQLISSYAHQGIFSQAYVELFAEHPNLVKFKPKDSQFSYVVREVQDGVFQFTATSQADLELVYETSDHRKYNAFGIQASMTLSKDKSPEDIEYSYYLR